MMEFLSLNRTYFQYLYLVEFLKLHVIFTFKNILTLKPHRNIRSLLNHKRETRDYNQDIKPSLTKVCILFMFIRLLFTKISIICPFRPSILCYIHQGWSVCFDQHTWWLNKVNGQGYRRNVKWVSLWPHDPDLDFWPTSENTSPWQ